MELGTFTIERTVRDILDPKYMEEKNSHVKRKISVKVEGEHRGGVHMGYMLPQISRGGQVQSI